MFAWEGPIALFWSRSRVSLPMGGEPGKGKLLKILSKYLPSVCWHWDQHKQGLHSNVGFRHKDMWCQQRISRLIAKVSGTWHHLETSEMSWGRRHLPGVEMGETAFQFAKFWSFPKVPVLDICPTLWAPRGQGT